MFATFIPFLQRSEMTKEEAADLYLSMDSVHDQLCSCLGELHREPWRYNRAPVEVAADELEDFLNYLILKYRLCNSCDGIRPFYRPYDPMHPFNLPPLEPSPCNCEAHDTEEYRMFREDLKEKPAYKDIVL